MPTLHKVVDSATCRSIRSVLQHPGIAVNMMTPALHMQHIAAGSGTTQPAAAQPSRITASSRLRRWLCSARYLRPGSCGSSYGCITSSARSQTWAHGLGRGERGSVQVEACSTKRLAELHGDARRPQSQLASQGRARCNLLSSEGQDVSQTLVTFSCQLLSVSYDGKHLHMVPCATWGAPNLGRVWNAACSYVLARQCILVI